MTARKGADAVRTWPCCPDGPPGHTKQEHHDASPCYDQACPFDHPHGGPFPHPCDRENGPKGPQENCPECLGWRGDHAVSCLSARVAAKRAELQAAGWLDAEGRFQAPPKDRYGSTT